MTPFNFSEVLTTGASGMIGAYVDFGLRPNHSTLDIQNQESVRAYVETHRPRVILHLAGATDMARCEQDPAYAYELNVRGTYNVARAARSIGAVMVYASTSRVFKGDKHTPYTEEDIPLPETHYGETKHMGELITAALVPQHIIARTAWVFGGGPERDNKFYGAVIRKLHDTEEEILALNDVHGSPTYGKDFIKTIKELLTNESYGTVHIANAGEATRFDIACALAARLDPHRSVRAVDRSYFATGASLPTNEAITSLKCSLRPWQEALNEYLGTEWTPYLK